MKTVKNRSEVVEGIMKSELSSTKEENGVGKTIEMSEVSESSAEDIGISISVSEGSTNSEARKELSKELILKMSSLGVGDGNSVNEGVKKNSSEEEISIVGDDSGRLVGGGKGGGGGGGGIIVMEGKREGLREEASTEVVNTSVGIMVVVTSIVKKSSVSDGERKKLSVASTSLVKMSISSLVVGNSVSLTGSLNGVKTPPSVVVKTGEGEGTSVTLGTISVKKMSVTKGVDATIVMDGEGVIKSPIEVVEMTTDEESKKGVVIVKISSVSRLITKVSEVRGKNESVGSISMLVKISIS